jgi:hypothetical protein
MKRVICYSLNVKIVTGSLLHVKERKETEMTMMVPSFDDAIIVREADAEVLGLAQLSTCLLADSDVAGGALSVMRTTMREGIEGARPHTHSKSAELFYILDGELQLLVVAHMSRMARCIGAMKKEEQTSGRSMITDLEKERVMRTKRARRWRKVLFQRSTWAVSPVSFPPAVCGSSAITAA